MQPRLVVLVRHLRIVTIVVLAGLALVPGAAAQATMPLSLFERYLDSLRQQAGIPGLSVAIVQHRQIVWESGLGYEDVENGVRASVGTPYAVGGLTQTFAATLLMQCAERGTLNLDAPIGQWTTAVPEPGATVRQVLAHASEGTPGTSFRFDLGRYAALGAAIEGCRDDAYQQGVMEEIVGRLSMTDSVPGTDFGEAGAPDRDLFDGPTLARFDLVLRRLAVPYKVDRSGKATRSSFEPRGMNAATGLVSTVRDLARFDAALDDGVVLGGNVRELMWTNVAGNGGAALPTGLGWFVQTYEGERIVWQFAQMTDAYSALILKVPGRDVTLIMLANSDGLSNGFGLANGDVTTSPFAKLFLRMFVI